MGTGDVRLLERSLKSNVDSLCCAVDTDGITRVGAGFVRLFESLLEGKADKPPRGRRVPLESIYMF